MWAGGAHPYRRRMHGRTKRFLVVGLVVSMSAALIAGCDDGFDPGIRTSCAMSSEYKATANNTPNPRVFVSSGCPARDWTQMKNLRDAGQYWGVSTNGDCRAGAAPTAYPVSETPGQARGLVRFDPNASGPGFVVTTGIQRAPACGHVETDLDIFNGKDVAFAGLKMHVEEQLVHRTGASIPLISAYIFGPDKNGNRTVLAALGLVLRPNGANADPRLRNIPAGGQHPAACIWYNGNPGGSFAWTTLDAGCDARGFARLPSLNTHDFTTLDIDWNAYLQWILAHVGTKSAWHHVADVLGSTSATIGVGTETWDQDASSNPANATIKFRNWSMNH